mgnify:CR=1 FL=1
MVNLLNYQLFSRASAQFFVKFCYCAAILTTTKDFLLPISTFIGCYLFFGAWGDGEKLIFTNYQLPITNPQLSYYVV